MVDYDAGITESFSDGLLTSPLINKQDKGLDSASSGGVHEATSATNESKEEQRKEIELATEEQILLRSVFVKNVDYSASQDEVK